MAEDYKEIPDTFRKWGLIILGGFIFVCLVTLVVVFLTRKQLSTSLIQALASETPVNTATSSEVVLDTLSPTETASLSPLPSETLMATPNRVPAMEIMTQIQGSPILDEQFLDNSRNWTGLGETADFLVQENQLQLRSTDPKNPAVLYCSGECGPYVDNYYYQVEFVEDRASEFGIGLVFGLDPLNSTLLNFIIRPSMGSYSLTRLGNGIWENLIDWTPSPVIQPFPQPNVLGVSFQKDNIQLYVNGTRVGSISQKDLSGEGRIGLYVERDGVRLLVNQVIVYQLVPFTSVSPTSQLPAPGIPSPTVKYTLTPTVPGSCPNNVPKGTWVLVVTKSSEGKGIIYINGVEHKVEVGVNVFYLQLDTYYAVKIGGKTHEYSVVACKIVYQKMK